MGAVAQTSVNAWLDRLAYPFKSHEIAVDGGKMHYLDEGEGAPILFLHDQPSWSFEFRHLIRELRNAGRRCLAPDLIGFGLSDKPCGFSHSPAAHTRNVQRLMDALDLREATVVGFGFGGAIAMSLAVEAGERVGRLVLGNTWSGDPSRDPAVQRAASYVSSPLATLTYRSASFAPKQVRAQFGDKSRFYETFEKALAGPFATPESRVAPRAVVSQWVKSGAWYDEIWSQREEWIHKPLMLLWGLKDPVFGERYLNRIWKEFPLADVAAFADSGPHLAEEKPREVLDAMKIFLKKEARGGYIA